MSVFIVSCNLELDALITGTREEVKRILLSKNLEVLETDLDVIKFFPFITVEEYQTENKESLSVAQLQAYPDKYSPDVLIEMDKIRKAKTLLVFVKPERLLIPTKFLGWVQRCLPIRFAVFSEENLFLNKSLVLITGENNCNRSQFDHLEESVIHIFKLVNLNLMTSRILQSIDDKEDFLSYLQNSSFN